MSKSDMLGSIRRALPAVRGRHLGLVRDVVHKLGGEDADAVHQSVAAALREKPAPVVQDATLVFHKKTMLNSTAVTVYCLGKRLTIAQMLRALMKLADDVPLDVVEKLAKDRKHPIPEARAEEMLESQAKFLFFLKQKGGKDFGLRDDGWVNLILVQYPDGTVSVARAYWGGVRWYRFVSSLDYDGVWGAGGRLVVSNSDTGNL
jgi:hypothetical protein